MTPQNFIKTFNQGGIEAEATFSERRAGKGDETKILLTKKEFSPTINFSTDIFENKTESPLLKC